jgi:DNA-binding NtrC family response regulator
MNKLLVIDDERNVRFSIADLFSDRESAIEVREAENGARGLEIVAQWSPDVILLDLRLGEESGLDVFQQIRAIDPKALVVLMTGFSTSDVAIEAMKRGAFDYIVKPLDAGQLRELVRQGCEVRRLVHVPAFVAETDRPETRPQELIGSGRAMRNACKQIGRIAPQDDNVLIMGESGTGKELVARAIYHHSRRNAGPFVAVNCAAASETLLESELFGHEKGANADAHQRRIGKFEQCDGGTLLLDEIGDLPASTQARLLRMLDEQRFERIGGTESVPCHVRILATTNRDLEELIQLGRFRRDLLYRLRTVTITLPPLRDRREDIPELAHHFLFQYAANVGSAVRTIAPETLDLLTDYSWPGNVRELQNVIRGALLVATGVMLLPACLPPEVLTEEVSAVDETLPPPATDDTAWQSIPALLDSWLAAGDRDLYRRVLEHFDRYVIGQVMKHAGGNQARASELLGLSRVTVRNKLRALQG